MSRGVACVHSSITALQCFFLAINILWTIATALRLLLLQSSTVGRAPRCSSPGLGDRHAAAVQSLASQYVDPRSHRSRPATPPVPHRTRRPTCRMSARQAGALPYHRLTERSCHRLTPSVFPRAPTLLPHQAQGHKIAAQRAVTGHNEAASLIRPESRSPRRDGTTHASHHALALCDPRYTAPSTNLRAFDRSEPIVRWCAMAGDEANQATDSMPGARADDSFSGRSTRLEGGLRALIVNRDLRPIGSHVEVLHTRGVRFRTRHCLAPESPDRAAFFGRKHGLDRVFPPTRVKRR